MKQKNDVFSKKLTIVFVFVFLAVILYYLFYCVLFVHDNPGYSILGSLVLFPAFYYCSYIMYLKYSHTYKYWGELYIIALSLVIYTGWALIAKTVPVSDYSVLINGGKAVANGTFPELSFDKTNYFYFYNFQAGYVFYLGIVMKLFGQRLIALRIFEIFILTLSNYLLFSIVSKIKDKKTAFISALVYTTLFFNILGSSIINNQHLSTLFVLIALRLILNKPYWQKALSGISLGLAIVFRPSSILFLLAVIIMAVYLIIRENGVLKAVLCSGLIMSAVCYATLFAVDTVLIQTKMVPDATRTAHVKYFKYVLGIKGAGLYDIPTVDAEHTNVYFDLEALDFDYEKYNELSKEYLINHIKNNPKEVLTHYNNKMISFVSRPDNQHGYSTTIATNHIGRFLNYYGYAQYVLLIFISGIYGMKMLKEKHKNAENLYRIFAMGVFLLFFFAHIIIEVQSRYRYDQYLCLAIMAAPIVLSLFDKVHAFTEKTKSRDTINPIVSSEEL